MATYFKYAERSAESQINWAEIGKNMTDMLKEENRIREEKKNAIDAASREFGQYLSEIPEGEHESAKVASLELADNASKFLLMQDRLLKQGLLSPKDYMIARQNLMDDTKNAYGAIKQFQTEYSKRIERARKSESALYELRKMEQVQGFGNWRQSGFYINPTTGNVSIAMKTEKDVDGKKVYTMDENPGKVASIPYVKGIIQGQWDRFDTGKVTSALADALGKEQNVAEKDIILGTLSSQGKITSIEDITARVDIDPDTKQVMFKFIDWENQSINAALANDFDRASVLTDSKKFAPNGKQYDFTNDPKEAAKNPNLILEVIDPNTGQGALKFTPEQIKASQEFMRTELRAKYDYEKKVDIVPQRQLQEGRAKTPAEFEQENLQADAENLGRNISFALTGDPAQAAAAVSYLSQKSGKLVKKTKEGIEVSNLDGTGKSIFGYKKDGSIQNPKAFARSVIGAINTGNIPERMVLNQVDKFVGNRGLNTTTEASGFVQDAADKKEKPLDAFNRIVTADVNAPALKNKVLSSISKGGLVDQAKNDIADALNESLGSKYDEIEFTPSLWQNGIYIKTKDGRESKVFPTGTKEKNEKALKDISEWMKKNYVKGANLVEKEEYLKTILPTLGASTTATGGTIQQGNVR